MFFNPSGVAKGGRDGANSTRCIDFKSVGTEKGEIGRWQQPLVHTPSYRMHLMTSQTYELDSVRSQAKTICVSSFNSSQLKCELP